MSTHRIVLEIRKLLNNLDGFLEKGVASAAARKFDPAVLRHNGVELGKRDYLVPLPMR
jgi:hypothetical protein